MNQDESEVVKKLSKADLQATNDLRKAIYDYEFKALVIWQGINSASIGLLINLLPKVHYNYLIIFAFFFFLMALFCTLIILYKSSSFLEARYHVKENQKRYKILEKLRSCMLITSSVLFLLGVIFSILGIAVFST